MIRASALAALLATPVAALDFTLPQNAAQTVVRNTSEDRYEAPIDVFADGALPTMTIEGAVKRGAWRIASPGLTAFQVMRPLRDQLVAAGYDIVLDCDSAQCGGFDFRFATEVLPGPNMYVNLRAYHVVTGLKEQSDDQIEAITLLASAAEGAAYLQIIQAGNPATRGLNIVAESQPDPQPQPTRGSLPDALLTDGFALLGELEFSSGSAELGPGPYPVLAELAAFLQAQPDMRVALVGHTDTVGGLDGNIAISRARAASVRQRLVDGYSVPPAQMDAEGMGYLSPVASNLAPEGREKNRRVEVILLNAN